MPNFVPPLSSIKNYGSCSASKFEQNVAYSSELVEREEEQTLEFSHSEGTSYSPDVKLFVGNLPFNVNSATLAELFEKTKNVEMVEVIYDQSLGRSRGFGCVTMFSVGEAEAVVQQINGHELQGREIRVNSGPPPPKQDNSSSEIILHSKTILHSAEDLKDGRGRVLITPIGCILVTLHEVLTI